MIRSRRFLQLDVFSAVPTRGNALAVVLDGEGLDEATMQRFAAWTNLAETTFLLPPENPTADYRVRIFTPTREMPFAGHPTLGSCVAWLHGGGVAREPGRVHQECGVGIVEIDLTGDVPLFLAPPTRIEPMPESQLETLVTALGIERACVVDSARLDNGPRWALLELASAVDVLGVDSSRVRWPEHPPLGLLGRQDAADDTDYEVRMLAPSSGMSEDPVTGSLNAAIAHWLVSNGRLERNTIIAQGTCIGRAGRVFVRLDPNDMSRVSIGGEVHVLIEGEIRL